MHFFSYDSSSGKYKDEDGLNLTIAAGSSGSITTYTMTDEDIQLLIGFIERMKHTDE